MALLRFRKGIVLIAASFALICPTILHAQNSLRSESVIKLNIDDLSTSAPIPFDRPFTLVIDKLSNKGLTAVQLHQVKTRGGNRLQVQNTFKDCNSGNRVQRSVMDISLNIDQQNDTLKMFFQALKPNKEFDVLLFYKLDGKNRENLMEVNKNLYNFDFASAALAYKKFIRGTVDLRANTTHTSITSLKAYYPIYQKDINALFSYIANPTNFQTGATMPLQHAQALDLLTSNIIATYADGNKLYEAVRLAKLLEIQNGQIDITNIFTSSSGINIQDVLKRRVNLEANKKFFDSAYERIVRVLSLGETSVEVDGSTVSTDAIRSSLEGIRANIGGQP